jgi:cellulose synthase/poly-beta-1,6-N-acetylglucosamine synthase-like glycosyltransferase
VERRLLSPGDLAWALQHREEVGEPLGTVLLAAGLVSRRDLYGALATVWGAELAFVEPTDLDPVLATAFDARDLAQEGWVPLRVQTGDDGRRTVVVAVAGRPREEVAETVRARTGIEDVHQVVTTDWDVHRALRTGWRDQLVHLAVRSLAEDAPEVSASRVATPRQVAGLVVALGLLVVAAVLVPHQLVAVLVVAVSIGFGVSVLGKLVVSLVGAAAPPSRLGVDGPQPADADLPHVTVLVPAYREAQVVGSLMRNLTHLDYPVEKLEILLLLEEDDPETLEAALAAAPPEAVRILVLPDSQPRTKPRACNIGLAFARGEYVVIYDAEDRPEPQQLRRAVAAFEEGGQDLVCVQAALNYFNPDENLLTRMFTLEYSSWFDNTLPGLDRLGLPIPLGGTSNHFRTDRLRALGGWDPYNVTEDADLGIRASARGWRVAVIDSTTFEEANKAVGNWIRQRSRWIKGYLQTFLVHSRYPLRFVRTVGLKQAAAFVLLIGGTPAAFLSAPVLWAVFGLSLAEPHLLPALTPALQLVNLLSLLVGNAGVVYLNLLATFRRRAYRLAPFAVLAPAYWVLHSVAAYKALWQLVTRPFYWEKTTHGLTNHADAPAPVVEVQEVTA